MLPHSSDTAADLLSFVRVGSRRFHSPSSRNRQPEPSSSVSHAFVSRDREAKTTRGYDRRIEDEEFEADELGGSRKPLHKVSRFRPVEDVSEEDRYLLHVGDGDADADEDRLDDVDVLGNRRDKNETQLMIRSGKESGMISQQTAISYKTDRARARNVAVTDVQRGHSPRDMRRSPVEQPAAMSSPPVGIDAVVKRNMKHLQAQVDALKKRLNREQDRRHDLERTRVNLEEENADLKMRFLVKVERLEKELLFYRNEFMEIEKRNDALEGMREDFLLLVDRSQTRAAELWNALRLREMMLRTFMALRNYAVSSKHDREEMQRMEKARFLQMSTRAMAYWRDFTVQKRRERDAFVRGSEWWRRHRLKHVLSKFHAAVRLGQQQRQKLRSLLGGVESHPFLALRDCFQSWHLVTIDSKFERLEEARERLEKENSVRLERSATSIARRIGFRLLQDVFHAWKETASFDRREREEALARAEEIRLEELKELFFSWKKTSRQLRRSREIIEYWKDGRERRCLREIMQSWHDFSVSQRRYHAEQKAASQEANVHVLEQELDVMKTVSIFQSVRRVFHSWHSYTTQTRKARSLLSRAFYRTRLFYLRVSMDEWIGFVAEQKRSRELARRADRHFRFVNELKCFRMWQEWVKERTRAKMISHKITLGLHIKGLVRNCEALVTQLEDLRREQESRQREVSMDHEEQKLSMENMVEQVQQFKKEIEELRRLQHSERENWESKTRQQWEDFSLIFEAAKRSRQAIERLRSAVEREISELNARTQSDRFTMKKHFEKTLISFKAKLENTSLFCEEQEEKYLVGQDFLRHALDDESQSVRDYKYIHQRVDESLTLMKSAVIERFDALLRKQEKEAQDAVTLEKNFCTAKEDVDELRETVEQEQEEFETMMKLYVGEDDWSDSSSMMSMGTSMTATSMLDLPEDIDPEAQLEAILEHARKMREEAAAARQKKIAGEWSDSDSDPEQDDEKQTSANESTASPRTVPQLSDLSSLPATSSSSPRSPSPPRSSESRQAASPSPRSPRSSSGDETGSTLRKAGSGKRVSISNVIEVVEAPVHRNDDANDVPTQEQNDETSPLSSPSASRSPTQSSSESKPGSPSAAVLASLPSIPNHRSGVSPGSGSEHALERAGMASRSSFALEMDERLRLSGSLVASADDVSRGHSSVNALATPSSMNSSISSASGSSQPVVRSSRAHSVMVRGHPGVSASASVVESSDGKSNRQLEHEVFRLRRRIDKQEKRLRKKYHKEIDRWRNKYEKSVELLIRADEWKKRYDIRCQERDLQLRNELESTRSSLDDAWKKEKEMAIFWRGKYKETENRLLETETTRRRESEKWRGLVRYYEDAFGVVSVSLTDVGNFRRRQGQGQSTAAEVSDVPATDTGSLMSPRTPRVNASSSVLGPTVRL